MKALFCAANRSSSSPGDRGRRGEVGAGRRKRGEMLLRESVAVENEEVEHGRKK
jgi:hypothetical protein